ncbi:MAG: hypothetical protein KDD35_12000, partial [Bdellovibrionales bacterium]|nr:hypothetical protein [Bdellovibrionales bacterium]
MKTDDLIKILFVRDLASGLRLEAIQPHGFPVIGFEDHHLLVSLPSQLAKAGTRLHVELQFKRDYINLAIPIKGEVLTVKSDPRHPDEFLAELKIFQKDETQWLEMMNTVQNLQKEVT